jgi:hypothetical protein
VYAILFDIDQRSLVDRADDILPRHRLLRGVSIQKPVGYQDVGVLLQQHLLAAVVLQHG